MDGTLRWETDLGVSQEPWTITEHGGAVVVAGLATDPDQGLVGQTTALDPATGEKLLIYRAFPAAQLHPGRLLFYRDQPPTYVIFSLLDRDGSPAPPTTAGLLPRGGVQLEATNDGQPAAWLVTLDEDGYLASYDLNHGGPTFATALVPAELANPSMWVIGELVLLRPRWDVALLEAYDVEKLSHRWTAEVDFWQAFECGTVICLAGPSSLHAIEPATGRPIWSVTDGLPDHPFGAHPAGPGWPAG